MKPIKPVILERLEKVRPAVENALKQAKQDGVPGAREATISTRPVDPNTREKGTHVIIDGLDEHKANTLWAHLEPMIKRLMT